MKTKWTQWRAAVRQAVATYLDDGLMLLGQGCLTAAAWELWDRPAGLAVLGISLMFDGWTVARAKSGGMRGGKYR